MSGWSHSSFRFQPQSVVELRRDELDSSWKRSSSLVKDIIYKHSLKVQVVIVCRLIIAWAVGDATTTTAVIESSDRCIVIEQIVKQMLFCALNKD